MNCTASLTSRRRMNPILMPSQTFTKVCTHKIVHLQPVYIVHLLIYPLINVCLCVLSVIACHYPLFIARYGMPVNYDSQVFEHAHQNAIHDIKLTSGRADKWMQLAKLEVRR
jgi:hypothetical protein